MIGYIYFLQMDNDIFKILTTINDIRNVTYIIKAKIANPEEKNKHFTTFSMMKLKNLSKIYIEQQENS